MLYSEIDLTQLLCNLDAIKRIAKKDVIPVIKSDAYRLGAIEIGKFLSLNNIKLMAVVDINEAIAVANVKSDLLVLNGISANDYHILNKFDNFVLTINSREDAINLANYTFSRKVKAHFKINVGINRSGFDNYDEFQKTYNLVSKNPQIIIEGIYTHFTDSKNHKSQEENFASFLKDYNFKYIHCAASSTYLHSQVGNYTRIGVDLFGDGLVNKQIVRIITKPLFIKEVKKGDTIGYDRAYQALEDELIAVLPIGYYNGFGRRLAGFPVLINNKRYPTVGKVCMNHLFVRVDNEVRIDSEVIITSPDLPIHEMAKYLQTISHEVLCMLNINDKRYIGAIK